MEHNPRVAQDTLERHLSERPLDAAEPEKIVGQVASISGMISTRVSCCGRRSVSMAV